MYQLNYAFIVFFHQFCFGVLEFGLSDFSLVQVEIRPMMYVALTYDHRLIDGREAVTFLRKIKSVVEDPRVLLLDM